MICRRCRLPIYRDGDQYRHAGSERVACRDGQGEAGPSIPGPVRWSDDQWTGTQRWVFGRASS